MTLDAFWKTISNARQATTKLVDMPAHLVEVLSHREEREILDYDCCFRDCMHRSYDANLWLGAVVILGGCGDDKFADFRCWLIAQGREAIESAIVDPDGMADLERFEGDHGCPILFYLNYVGQRAFCKRAAGDPDDFASRERFESLSPAGKHPPLRNQELVNTSYEDAKLLLPRLSARFPSGIRAGMLK